MIRKTLPLLVAGLCTAFLATATLAEEKPAAATSGRGTVKGGSDYERSMQQAGMSGMSGMSGEHSMTAKKPAGAKKKKAGKKKAAAAAAK